MREDPAAVAELDAIRESTNNNATIAASAESAPPVVTSTKSLIEAIKSKRKLGAAKQKPGKDHGQDSSIPDEFYPERPVPQTSSQGLPPPIKTSEIPKQPEQLDLGDGVFVHINPNDDDYQEILPPAKDT